MSLLVELLATQQELSPVERLARRYDELPATHGCRLRAVSHTLLTLPTTSRERSASLIRR